MIFSCEKIRAGLPINFCVLFTPFIPLMFLGGLLRLCILGLSCSRTTSSSGRMLWTKDGASCRNFGSDRAVDGDASLAWLVFLGSSLSLEEDASVS